MVNQETVNKSFVVYVLRNIHLDGHSKHVVERVGQYEDAKLAEKARKEHLKRGSVLRAWVR